MNRRWLFLIVLLLFSAGMAFYFLRPKEPAPLYAEIKQEIGHIMSKWDIINEPKAPDFKFAPEVMKEFNSYNVRFVRRRH